MSSSIVPTHVGYIVDGNRRWAKLKSVSSDVHRRGADVVYDIAKQTIKSGIKYATFFVFSTENWNRSKEEVDYLMNLFVRYFKERIDELKSEDIKVLFLGTRDGLNDKVLRVIDETEESTKSGKNGVISFCFNYGGYQEIVDATKQLIMQKIKPEDVTADMITANIYHPEVPPMDIVVRTGGERRISNFMLWRMAYSELFFIDKLWPEMEVTDVDVIIDEYANRNRRFGK
jgi:undecaprenyl diphosphate synthase